MSNIPPELLDELLKNYSKPEDLTGPDGLLKQLTAALVERAMQAEMTQHLGYKKGDPAGANGGNSRNGLSSKKLKTDRGELDIHVPRDRDGSFEPQLVKKRQTRFDGFDDKILSMYARGMTVRDIRGHLEELYGVNVSPDLISAVTSEVMEELQAWQHRPLEAVYPIIYLDALVAKVRVSHRVVNRSLYTAIGINQDGRKEILGLWLSGSEGAKFWMQVVSELRERGVEDIFFACVDGLKGFPEAIEAVFPHAVVQTCIVHMVRNSLRFVGWKERKEVAAALRRIYSAESVDQAATELDHFEENWGTRFPSIVKSWRANWERVTPFLDYPAEIRHVIYTTNAIEALHSTLRKSIRPRGHFPNDDALLKLAYLSLRKVEQRWKAPPRTWKKVQQQLIILFEDRFTSP